KAAFFKVQQAWCGQDLAPARPLVSDGVMARFTVQLEMLKADGKRDRMDRLEVREARLLEAESGPRSDTLHVCLRASAVDSQVSLADGSLVGGSGQPEEFSEVWSFLRRREAGTAPDWLLCEITQLCEWSPRRPGRDVPGWAELCARDPGLDAQSLEDRASVIFWRWLYALRRSDAGLMRGAACDSFCAQLAERLRDRPARYQDPAAGRVTLLAVEPGGELDRAHVGVKWSAADAVLEHVFVLARNPAGDERGWVLLEIVPAGLWRRPAASLTAAPQGPEAADWGAALSPADALAALVSVITVDGKVDEKEMACLQSYAKKRRIPPDAAERVIAAANAGALEIPAPQEPAQVQAVLRGLIRMSLADGAITDSELRLINSFAAARSLSVEDVRGAIAEQRAALYRQAQKALSAL
ncbi:MAG: TIM44-like domain-containing protein, partial [Elusimicrobia bacterium]|nr:TIM44-like domain-containing protein [Elusimicrobiota bacterium]